MLNTNASVLKAATGKVTATQRTCVLQDFMHWISKVQENCTASPERTEMINCTYHFIGKQVRGRLNTPRTLPNVSRGGGEVQQFIRKQINIDEHRAASPEWVKVKVLYLNTARNADWLSRWRRNRSSRRTCINLNQHFCTHQEGNHSYGEWAAPQITAAAASLQ